MLSKAFVRSPVNAVNPFNLIRYSSGTDRYASKNKLAVLQSLRSHYKVFIETMGAQEHNDYCVQRYCHWPLKILSYFNFTRVQGWSDLCSVLCQCEFISKWNIYTICQL